MSTRPRGRERKRRRAPTRGDLVLLALLALLVPATQRWTRPAGPAAMLLVRSDSGTQQVDAGADTRLEVRGPLGVTEVRLRDGEAWIARSPCRNQLCRRMGRVRARGRSLVCIPNRVVVHFAGGTSRSGTDAITR